MNQFIQLDQKITLWFRRLPAGLHPLMFVITQLGSVALIMVASAVLAALVYSKHHARVAYAFAAIIPAEFFNAGLKLLFDRTRPNTQFAHDMFLHTKSFPSGHAFGSFVFYGLLAYLAFNYLPHGWNRAVPLGLGVLIMLIGVSRVYLGAHYILDVLGGWVVAALILFMIIRLARI